MRLTSTVLVSRMLITPVEINLGNKGEGSVVVFGT